MRRIWRRLWLRCDLRIYVSHGVSLRVGDLRMRRSSMSTRWEGEREGVGLAPPRIRKPAGAAETAWLGAGDSPEHKPAKIYELQTGRGKRLRVKGYPLYLKGVHFDMHPLDGESLLRPKGLASGCSIGFSRSRAHARVGQGR